MPSPFDFSTFMSDTAYDATAIDYKWHVVPEGEYMAQIKEFARGREMDKDKFNGRLMVGADIVWTIQDENLKSELNMQEVNAAQGLLIDLTSSGTIDWGTNKNQRLKDVVVATGTNNNKKFNLGHLLHQVAWVQVKHETDRNDSEKVYSRVVKVMPLEAGRAAYDAKRAA